MVEDSTRQRVRRAQREAAERAAEPERREAHPRHVEISPDVLGEEATAAYAITNAGCQGKTCRKKLRICDVDNPYMTAEHLYVALSRATEEGNVRIQ